MKSKLAALLAFLILFSSGIVLMAAELQPIAFTFTGRWQPTDDPVLIDDYGLQDIQNLRREGKHFKGVAGSTKINTTLLSSYPYILNGFHFRKDNPSESHVMVVASQSSLAASVLYQNTTAIPSSGDFSSTLVHTDTTNGVTNGMFSQAPNGNMIYTNGPETLIWGGSEIPATAFIAAATSLTGTTTIITNPTEYTSQVTNTRQTADQVALIGGGIDDYVKLLLHGDGADGSTTFTDEAGHTVERYGDAQIDTSQYKFASGSIQFDGTGDAIYAEDSDDWNFGTGAFTVDFWVRFNALPAAGQAMVIYSQRSDADNGLAFALKNFDGNYLYDLYVCSAGSCESVGAPYMWPTSVSVNTWYHVALAREELAEHADYFSVWQDGDRRGANLDNITYPDVLASFVIGGITAPLTDGPTYVSMNGRIDEFRVSKGIARWSHASDFTPPVAAYRSAANNWLVGFPRPIQGVKFYVSDPNVTTSTMTAEEWNGVSWANLSITDNTAAGGITLAQTGTVTFSSSVNRAKQRYIHGYSLYWYQFHISDGMASIYYCTGDAPIQAIRNVWSGREAYASKVLKYATDYKESTDALNDDVEATTMDLSSLPNTGYVLAGFTSPQQALHVYMEPDNGNSTTSNALTLYYWNGQAWYSVSGLSDGTATSDKGLNKSGVISWNPLGAGVEFPVAVGDETPLYYYKLVWAGTLDSSTKMSELSGIESPATLGTYRLATHYQNRVLLMNEYNGHRNKIIYSMSNAPDIFNGTDTGTIYVGDETDITAAVSVYNIFANTAYDQLIIGKESEIYRLAGDDALTWTLKRISENVGCVAPLSMVSVEVTGEDKSARRQVAIFQGDTGFYMTDGATVMPISQDIKCYFDPNDSRYIPASRRTKTVAWYDPSIRSYKALISSGSTATYHNIELEYNLDTREWFKIHRETASGADPLQSGWRVWDTNGLGYTYGGNLTGQVYRLENGTTWAGTTGITQYLQTKDLILDSVAPFFRKSTVKNMRVGVVKKTNGGTVSIAHYGDQVLTVNGSSNQVVPSAITVSTAPYNTQSCNMGPFLYHSFKLTASAATVADGMELTGIGLWVEPYTAIR